MMGPPDASRPFDPSAALAVLDAIIERQDAVVLQGAASAWEAAWIACITNSATWAAVAEDEFAQVVLELHGILWTVDRRRSRSRCLNRESSRSDHLRLMVADGSSPAYQARLASLGPSPSL